MSKQGIERGSSDATDFAKCWVPSSYCSCPYMIEIQALKVLIGADQKRNDTVNLIVRNETAKILGNTHIRAHRRRCSHLQSCLSVASGLALWMR